MIQDTFETKQRMNRAKFIEEANQMLIGMAPHVASRKTANMLREAVEELSTIKDNQLLRNHIFNYFEEEHGLLLLESELDTVAGLFRNGL